MKLLIALAALFAFLAVCSWHTTPGGFLGAGDIFQTGFIQTQDGECQHQDVATPEAESLNLFPNEKTNNNYDGQSVLDSRVWFNAGFLQQRYGGEIRHSAYFYKPELTNEIEDNCLVNGKRVQSPANRLII